MQTVTGSETDERSRPGRPDGRRRALGWIVVAVLVLGGAGVVIGLLVNDRAELQDRVAELEESLQISRGDAGEQIEQLEATNAALDEQIAELESAVATIAEELTDAQGQVDDLTAQLEERTAERDQARAELEELRTIVEEVGEELVEMPDLLGATRDDVDEFVETAGAELIVEEVAPDNVIARPGDVIEQLPVEGTVVLPDTVVWVQIYTPPLEGDGEGDGGN